MDATRHRSPERSGEAEEIVLQIAHSRRDYARVVALYEARRGSNLPQLALSFGDMPGRGPVGYYRAMASWHLDDVPAVREQIETAVRMANPEGLQHGRIQTGIAILRRREGRDAEMREACRQLIDFFPAADCGRKRSAGSLFQPGDWLVAPP